MIKLLRLVLVLALTLPVISIIPKSLYAQTAQPTPPPLTGSTSISCNNFASDLYYKLEYPFMAGGRYAYVNPVYVTFKKDMNTLHQILASKSISVSDSEKGNTPKFGKSTTEAVIQFQEQFKSQIGLTRPSGIVDEKTRQYLNQQYGCIDKALVTLTEPNKNTIRARGESLAIKWTASKIPNTTDITIKYVNSTNPSASSTIITLPNIRNGKGEYLWTIPSTFPAGSYKIVVALTGSVKSDESNAPFEVRETALEILTPNTEVALTAGSRLPITWKTSTALKSSDKIKINLQGTLISDGQSVINVEIAKVPNTGSYMWTVPDRINNKIVTTTSAFRIILQSEVGNYTSTSSPVVQINPSPSVQTSAITLSQPTSSAQYQTGQTIPVRWTSKGLKTTDDVQLSLVAKTGANAGTYTIGTVKNVGSTGWLIPASLSSFNLATTTLNQYQILAVSTANTSVRATSSTFSIVPTPVIPTVVSGISFTPQPAQVGSQMTAYFKNGGSHGSVMIKTLDGTKRWFVPYKTDAVVPNGFVRYDGNKVTFTVPSTIGLGPLPENTGYEAPIPLTTGTYNASIWSDQMNSDGSAGVESKITPIKINAISQPPVAIAPKITVTNITGPVVRGSSIAINWTTNGTSANPTFGNGARVTAKLVRTNGSTDTQMASSPAVVPSTGTATIVVPTNATPSASSTTSTDYKVVLTVSGLASGTSLDVTSDLTTDGFAVVSQGANSTLTAQTNIPTAENNIVFRGSPLSVNVVGTNIPNNTVVTARLVGVSGQAANLALSATGRMTANATAVTLNIPTTFSIGTYKVSVNTTVDTRPLETFTSTFEVKDRPVVLPKITIGTVPPTVEKGVSFPLTWTSNSVVNTLGKVKIELVNADTGLVERTFATNISPSANIYNTITIPTGFIASSTSAHKLRITPESGLVNLDPTSVLNSSNFHINTPTVTMTATLDKTSVVKGSPLAVSFTGSVPTLSRVIATIVKPDNSPVVGSPTINTAMGSSRATLPVPASLPVGQYKIYLSSTVNGVLVQAYSPEFAVVNPNPVFTIDGTPVISNIFGNTGKTTSLTAVFNMKAQANGAILAKLAPTNFTVVFQDDVTGSTTPASTVVVTSASVANGATGNVKVTATIQNAPLTTSGYFKAKINGITWAMGTAPNTTTGTETAGLTAFVTPRIVFVK